MAEARPLAFPEPFDFAPRSITTTETKTKKQPPAKGGKADVGKKGGGKGAGAGRQVDSKPALPEVVEGVNRFTLWMQAAVLCARVKVGWDRNVEVGVRIYIKNIAFCS